MKPWAESGRPLDTMRRGPKESTGSQISLAINPLTRVEVPHMRRKVAIWLDDQRDPTKLPWSLKIDPLHTVKWVRDREEFEAAVLQCAKRGELSALHFDNDLGVPRYVGEDQEGRHCFTWFESQVREHGWGPVGLHAHTANPAALKELTQGFASLRKYWAAQTSGDLAHAK